MARLVTARLAGSRLSSRTNRESDAGCWVYLFAKYRRREGRLSRGCGLVHGQGLCAAAGNRRASLEVGGKSTAARCERQIYPCEDPRRRGLGNLGGQDHGVPPKAVHAFDVTVNELGKSVDTSIYPNTGHAFENPNNKLRYSVGDTADALGRIDRFFCGKPEVAAAIRNSIPNSPISARLLLCFCGNDCACFPLPGMFTLASITYR